MSVAKNKSPAIMLDTRTRLINAATQEFCSNGFDGTDTNRIAKQAGFAPQTFYRWFADKTEIFLAVYRVWEDEERRTLNELITHQANTLDLAQTTIDHHRTHRIFRRSLRQLAVENPLVRKARADSRARQIEQIALWSKTSETWSDANAIILLQIERLADAAAEAELADLGVPPEKVLAAIADLIAQLRS